MSCGGTKEGTCRESKRNRDPPTRRGLVPLWGARASRVLVAASRSPASKFVIAGLNHSNRDGRATRKELAPN